MPLDEEKQNELYQKIKNAIETITSMDMWLPRAIHNALNPLDDGWKKMIQEGKEDKQREIETKSFKTQIEASQRQTKYLLWTFIVTLIFSVINSTFQIVPELYGLIFSKEQSHNTAETTQTDTNTITKYLLYWV